MLKNENVYSKIFLKLMKNQYFQFFLRHWFLNLWRLINIWIWYLELAFIPLWLIRKKESDQIKIRKIILKLWVFELIWGKMFCSSFFANFYCSKWPKFARNRKKNWALSFIAVVFCRICCCIHEFNSKYDKNDSNGYSTRAPITI